MPEAVAGLLHEREMLIDAFGELVQVFDSQSRRRQRTDDVAKAVHPIVSCWNCLAVIGIVRTWWIFAHRGLEIRILKLQLSRHARIAAHLSQRMKLRDIEEAARFDETSRDLGPSLDVGKPAQRAV